MGRRDEVQLKGARRRILMQKFLQSSFSVEMIRQLLDKSTD